jgi:hypothetical protein
VTISRVELGCAGHLIVSDRCRWRRHTQVGHYRISTLGDYWLHDTRQRVSVGAHAYFETMVFATTGRPDAGNEGCGCQELKDWSELDLQRYATAGEAQRGHEAMVEKYIMIAEGELVEEGVKE